MYLISRIIYFIGGIIVTVLGLRFLFELLGIGANVPFVGFIYNFSEPFVAPFYRIFNFTPTYGAFKFDFSTLLAIVIYAIATSLIAGLLGGFNSRRYPTY
jgi:YggT family protein